MVETTRRAVIGSLLAGTALSVLPEPLKAERVEREPRDYTLNEAMALTVLTVSIPDCHIVRYTSMSEGQYLLNRLSGPAVTFFTFGNRLELVASDTCQFGRRHQPLLATNFFSLDEFLHPGKSLYSITDPHNGWFLYDPDENTILPVGPRKAPIRAGKNMFSIKLLNGRPIVIYSITVYAQTTVMHRLRYHGGGAPYSYWSAELDNERYLHARELHRPV